MPVPQEILQNTRKFVVHTALGTVVVVHAEDAQMARLAVEDPDQVDRWVIDDGSTRRPLVNSPRSVRSVVRVDWMET